jgi:hypothetical protein
MNPVDTPQTRCRAGTARGDITPPVGIYHRMWGAATHERATGVHRPLLADVLWLEPLADGPAQGQFVVALDHCILEKAEVDRMSAAICRATGVAPAQVQVAEARGAHELLGKGGVTGKIVLVPSGSSLKSGAA